MDLPWLKLIFLLMSWFDVDWLVGQGVQTHCGPQSTSLGLLPDCQLWPMKQFLQAAFHLLHAQCSLLSLSPWESLNAVVLLEGIGGTHSTLALVQLRIAVGRGNTLRAALSWWEDGRWEVRAGAQMLPPPNLWAVNPGMVGSNLQSFQKISGNTLPLPTPVT